MSPDPDLLDIVHAWFDLLCTPGAQALRVGRAHNLRSLKNIAVLAERMGYEVAYADLPASVSGFAKVIDGIPFIVVNRHKHPAHQQYTIAHELAHHLLHVQPQSVLTNMLHLPTEDFAEIQAHLFAASWLIYITSPQERDAMVKQNPDAFVFPFVLMVMTIGLGLAAGLGYLLSRFISPKPAHIGEGKWKPTLPSADSTPGSPPATN
jgi:hypothetical protein